MGNAESWVLWSVTFDFPHRIKTFCFFKIAPLTRMPISPAYRYLGLFEYLRFGKILFSQATIKCHAEWIASPHHSGEWRPAFDEKKNIRWNQTRQVKKTCSRSHCCANMYALSSFVDHKPCPLLLSQKSWFSWCRGNWKIPKTSWTWFTALSPVTCSFWN